MVIVDFEQNDQIDISNDREFFNSKRAVDCRTAVNGG
jgi:hypothetical protein